MERNSAYKRVRPRSPFGSAGVVTVLSHFRHSFVTFPAQFWHISGTVLSHFRHSIGTVWEVIK